MKCPLPTSVRLRLTLNAGGKRRCFVRSCASALMALAVFFVVGAPAAHAHSPHDVIISVEISPDYEQDRTVFLITDTPGWWKPTNLYRSVDGGVSWQSITNGLDNRREASDIQLSPAFGTDGLAYMATAGDGIYRSADGAQSWTASNTGLGTRYISRLALSPAFAADGMILAAGIHGGLYVSYDRGATWSESLSSAVQVVSLAFAAAENGRVLALAGDANGVLHGSDDRGVTWQEWLRLPESGAITAIAVSPSFAADSTYYMGTEGKGLWRIVDGAPVRSNFPHVPASEQSHGECCPQPDAAQGMSATLGVYLPALHSNNEVDPIQDGLSIASLAVSPGFAQDGMVFAAAHKRLAFRTSDRGDSWQKMGAEDALTHRQADEYGEPDFFDVAVSPAFATDGTMFLAGFRGLFKSEDGGDTWKELETLGSGLPTGLSVSPNYARDGHVVVATQHAGSIVTHDRGNSWESWNRGMSDGRLYGIEHSPNFATDRFFFSFARDRMRRVTDNTTTYDWEAWPYGERPPDPNSGETLKVNFPEASAVSPNFASDSIIFLGTRHYGLYVSNDGGQTWRESWEREYSAASFAMSPSFATDRTMFVSILNDGVFRSTDGGASWQRVRAAAPWLRSSDTVEFPYWHYIDYLAISPNFAVDRTLFSGTSDGLFKSVDGGDSWNEVAQFADRFVVALAVSPNYAGDGTVFVSVKGLGLFKSEDGGASFAQIAPELLRDQELLRSIEVSPNYAADRTLFGHADHVYRSTDGGATWQRLARPIRYENHKHPIRYEGNWEVHNDVDSSMSGYSYSGEAGHRASLDFAGTGVTWHGTLGQNLGIADVYLDGVLQVTVDQYSPQQQHEVELWSVRDLSPGPHTITVEVTGWHNPNADGTRITVDAFEVFGYEVAASGR